MTGAERERQKERREGETVTSCHVVYIFAERMLEFSDLHYVI